MVPTARRQPATDTVSAVLLCGGAGSRLGGVDKGLVELAGRPMVEHVLERLAAQLGGQIVISCNRNEAVYRRLGLSCVADAAEFAGQGPLAGVAAGLALVRTPLCMICPCDTPLIPHDLVARMLTALQSTRTAAAVAHDGRQLQPLHCLLATQQHERLLEFLRKGGRAVHAWLDGLESVPVDFSSQPDAFRNLNTTADLQFCETALKEKHPCNR